MEELVLIHERDTKNFGVYLRDGEVKPMSRVYMPLGLAKKLTYKLVPSA